jgi:hypothetical protein
MDASPSKVDMILSPQEQLVFDFLAFSKDVNPYQIYKRSRDKISLSGVQKILERFTTGDQQYTEELPRKKASKGGPSRRTYKLTTRGVYHHACTMLKEPRQLLMLGEAHPGVLPLSLGKNPHFQKEEVLDVALAAWKRINPLDHNLPTIKTGDVQIQPQTLLQDMHYLFEDIKFHFEVWNAPSHEDLQRWYRAIQRDMELKKFTDDIRGHLRYAYHNAASELGIIVIEDVEA